MNVIEYLTFYSDLQMIYKNLGRLYMGHHAIVDIFVNDNNNYYNFSW